MSDAPATLRVDKWLWAARFFKTRSLAAQACAGGKVDVNGEAAKPARAVRPGDRITVTLPGGHKLKTLCNLIVGEHAMLVEAIVMRQPDENRL